MQHEVPMDRQLESMLIFHYRRTMRETTKLRRGQITLVIVRRRLYPDGPLTVDSVWVRFRGRDHQLALGATHLLLLYILCRSGTALTAVQIAIRLDQSQFVEDTLAGSGPRTSRARVRKQIERLRDCLRNLFSVLQISANAEQVIQTVSTSTSQVLYKANAHIVFKDIE